jgi:hypothetical protein
LSEKLRDIRELADDPEAYAEELQRRWGGLLSYRYIGRNHGSLNVGALDNTVKLRRDMRNPAGGLLVAPLAIASPESGHATDIEAVPNPVILSVQVFDDARDVERVEIVRSEVLKEGSRMAYSRCLIVDADNHDRLISFNEGQGVVIGAVPPGLEKLDGNMPEIVDSPDLPPLWQVFGCFRRNDGHWALPPLSLELASPDAALHIGPQHVLLETAANEAAAQLVGSD